MLIEGLSGGVRIMLAIVDGVQHHVHHFATRVGEQ